VIKTKKEFAGFFVLYTKWRYWRFAVPFCRRFVLFPRRYIDLVGVSEAAEHLLKWAECMARKMIERHWGKVQKLAAAVVEKQKFTGNGRFSGAEIRDVLGGSGRNGNSG
jgi:hypothetical protein